MTGVDNNGAFLMGSLIYRQSIRDDGAEGPSEANTVVHEVGRLLERPWADPDFHDHPGVMNRAAVPGRSSNYAPQALERTRSRNFNAL